MGLNVLWIKNLSQQHMELVLQRTKELGYNALLLEAANGSDVAHTLNLAKNQNIRIILKLNPVFAEYSYCPLDTAYADCVAHTIHKHAEWIAYADYIFWESQAWHQECQEHPLTYDATQKDLVSEEISLLEKSVPKSSAVMLYLPAKNDLEARQQAEIATGLLPHIDIKTVIAFSAYAGDPWADHLPDHPLWGVLRRAALTLACPKFLPIVNIGSVNQGEGLWPALPFDLVDKFILPCNQDFAGYIALTNAIPKRHSFLECSLSAARLAAEHKQPSFISAESWFAINRPHLDFSRFSAALSEIRDVVKKLSFLLSIQDNSVRNPQHNELCRALSEQMLSHLKWLQLQFANEKKLRNRQHLVFQDYFCHFAADARRLINHVLQSHAISLVHWRQEDDAAEGVWTHKESKRLLASPRQGEPDSALAKIAAQER